MRVCRIQSKLPNEDPIQSQVAREDEFPSRIGLHHMCVRLIVAADGKASGRRAGRPRRANRTAVVNDICGWTKFTVGPHRQHGHSSAMVVGDENIPAGRMNAEMSRARSLGTDGIQ